MRPVTPATPSRPSWPPWVGTSTRPSWSGSTAPSGSMWPRSGDGAAPCARAKMACGSSWLCVTAPTISVGPMPAYASPCHSPSPPTGPTRPRGGGRVRRPWPRGSPTMSGHCVRGCCAACRRGHSQQGWEHPVVVGSGQGRWSGQAMCVRTAGGDSVTRSERATEMSCRPSRPGWFALVQGHSVFVEILHARFSEAIKGCVRGGTLLAGHPPRAPQPLPTVGPDDSTATSAH